MEENVLFVVAEKWNEGYSVSNISDKMKFSIATIKNYLRLGNKIKICDYSTEENMKRRKNFAKIYCVELDKYFLGAKECCNYMKKETNIDFKESSICSIISHGTKYHGYTFIKIDK